MGKEREKEDKEKEKKPRSIAHLAIPGFKPTEEWVRFKNCQSRCLIIVTIGIIMAKPAANKHYCTVACRRSTANPFAR